MKNIGPLFNERIVSNGKFKTEESSKFLFSVKLLSSESYIQQKAFLLWQHIEIEKNRGELEFVIGAAKTDFGEINSGKFWCFR